MSRREDRSEGAVSFKAALHESLHRSDQPLKAIAEACGTSVSYLAHGCDIEQPDAHVTGRLFPVLAAQCSNPAFLDYLEAKAGRVAVRVPTGSGAHVHALGALARETGEVLQQVADALDDNRITVAEWRIVDKNITDVLQAAALLREAILQRVENGTHRSSTAGPRADAHGTEDSERGCHGWSRAACVPPGKPTH